MADPSARDRAIAHAQEDIVSGDPGDEAMPPQIAAWVIDGLLARPGVLEALAATGGVGTATPADPRPNDAVHQEALRIIRAAWHALPPAVGSEIVKDGATLAGCIRAIPVGDPPLVSAALAVLDEIDRTGHVGEDDPTVGRLRDALSRPARTPEPTEETR